MLYSITRYYLKRQENYKNHVRAHLHVDFDNEPINKYAFEIGNVKKKLILILKTDLSFWIQSKQYDYGLFGRTKLLYQGAHKSYLTQFTKYLTLIWLLFRDNSRPISDQKIWLLYSINEEECSLTLSSSWIFDKLTPLLNHLKMFLAMITFLCSTCRIQYYNTAAK